MTPFAPRLALNISYLERGYIPCSRPRREGEIYHAKVSVGDIVDTPEDIRRGWKRVWQVAHNYAQRHGLEATASQAEFDACSNHWRVDVHVYNRTEELPQQQTEACAYQLGGHHE